MLRILGMAVAAVACLSLGLADAANALQAPDEATGAASAPHNDDFANASSIGIPSTSSGTNVGASLEANEPVPSCSGGSASVWFRVTPGTTGTLVAATAGSDFDTLLALYSGSGLGSLTELACDDERGGQGASILTAGVSAGATYHLRLAGYAASVGNYSLQVSQTATPANDDFTQATLIGLSSVTSGSTAGATTETGEPDPSCRPGTRASIWFRLEPIRSGTLAASTAGSSFDTVLTLYSGPSLGALSAVQNGCNDDAAGALTSRFSTSVIGGTTYHLRLAGYGDVTGSYVLETAFSGTGSLTAAPNPVPAGPGMGSTRITWNTSDGSFTRVYVSRDGSPAEVLFGEGPSGSQDAPWILSGSTYKFRLYQGSARSVVLAEVTVSRPPSFGGLTASPNPAASGPGPGTTAISWSTSDGSTAQVYVSRDGGPELLFAEGTAGSKNAPWISTGSSYRFRLYQGSSRAVLLDEVVVTRPLAGTLTASPNPVPSGPGPGLTTVTWNSNDDAQVYVSKDGGSETLVGQGPSGSQAAPWIATGAAYKFRLYQGSARSVILAEVTVTRPPLGTLRASPNPVPAGSGLGATTITWSTSDGSPAQVYVSMNGGAEVLFAQDSSGSQAAPWILSGNSYEFRLYAGTSRATLLATTLVSRAL